MLLFPIIESSLTDAHLAAYLGDKRSGVGLTKGKIVYKMPELSPLAEKPNLLLDRLAKSYGPYQEPVQIESGGTQSEGEEIQEDKTDNLSNLGRTMNTSNMKKKKRSTDPIKQVKLRRK